MASKESLIYIQPQRLFKKMIKAFDKADQLGYYELAGARPTSVLVLKQPIAGLPAGTKLLWFCGESEFHTPGAAFAGKLNCRCDLRFLPIEDVLYEHHLDGIECNTAAASENAYLALRSYKLTLGRNKVAVSSNVVFYLRHAAAVPRLPQPLQANG